MDTIKIFESTKMYHILSKVCTLLKVNFDLTRFKYSSPFWMADEASYLCFLLVLENEYDVFMSQKMTRSRTDHIKYVIEEVLEMLIEHVPDDKIEATIDTRCVICLFNKASVELKCGHTLVCQKCYNIMGMRSIKTCPLCRQSLC
jgi:hypothetical protein